MGKVVLPDKWLVIAPNSLVGSKFVELADGDLTKVTSDELDITNEEQVIKVIGDFPGRVVINFAGMTLVDEVEKTKPHDPTNETELSENMAYKVNVLGTRYIAGACKKANKFPIFISTGFVFDGKNGPYNEDSPVASDPDEVSWYAWTKILAEKEASGAGIDCLNIRISYPYRSEYEGKGDFARNFLNLYDGVEKGEKNWYPIFTDQALTPTLIDDLPAAVKVLMDKSATGTYHVTSPLLCTPYEFCCELLKVARGVENPESLVPKGSLVEFQKAHPEIAKRPLHGGEKVDKIQALEFIPTTWKEGIKKTFGKIT